MSTHNDYFSQSSVSARVAEIITGQERVAYLTVSPGLIIQTCSANARKLLDRAGSLPEKAMLTDFIWEFVGVEDELEKILAGEMDEYRLETVNWINDKGEVEYYEMTALPLSDKKTDAGLILLVEEKNQVYSLQQRVVQDRNELRLLQLNLAEANANLQRLNRLKSVFMSMVAHDLRGPLTGILGYAQLLNLLIKDEENETGREYIARIQDQVGHMNRLIADMLDLDQIDKGMLRVHPVIFDLNDTIDEGIEILKDVILRKGLVLQTDIQDGPIPIFADPKRAAQIFHNLLNNAHKYSLAGGTITVTAWSEPEWGVFRITDTGVGMDDEDLGNLFQLYYRTEKARTSRTKGTGIGLFIVKSLLDALSGKIEVTSKSGEGSEFTVYFPKYSTETTAQGEGTE